jgi:glucosyl-dolichyl phosphate glucuronosyltransferase
MSELADITVIICAYTEERWDFTLEAIESARHQRLRPIEIIVVVDHNPKLEERLRRHDPVLRVLKNTEQKGLAGGRNSGIAASRSEFIAFLDDDARADPEWLSSMAGNVNRAEVIGVGSRVDPWWIGVRPAWFPDEFLWVVGCTYRGLPKSRQAVRNLLGGGMLVRRSVFERVGGFNPSLGRSGANSLLSCEDTEFCVRAQAMLPGTVLLYEPNASIRHRVSAKRLTWDYLWRRCYAEGLSKSVMARMVGRPGLSSEWRHTTLVLPTGILHGLAAVLRGDIGGLGRTAAIIVGFGAAAIGFLRGQAYFLQPTAPPAIDIWTKSV